MTFEQPSNLPEEIIIGEPVLKKNSEGKQYEYEKDGVYYGGDYLPEPPQVVHLDIPPAPKEEPPIVI